MAFIITLPSGPATSPSFMPAGHAPTHFISIALSTELSALRVSSRIPVLPVSFAGKIFGPRTTPTEMRLSLGKRNRQALMASIMLVAFASRGLIAPGFMPASDRPFSLEICWEGLPADMLAHVEPSQADSGGMAAMGMGPHDSMLGDPGEDSTSHRGRQQGLHRHGSPSQSEHCVFGTACSAGPIPNLPPPGRFLSARQLRTADFASNPVAVRVVHLPQSRAPPDRLS